MVEVGDADVVVGADVGADRDEFSLIFAASGYVNTLCCSKYLSVKLGIKRMLLLLLNFLPRGG